MRERSRSQGQASVVGDQQQQQMSERLRLCKAGANDVRCTHASHPPPVTHLVNKKRKSDEHDRDCDREAGEREEEDKKKRKQKKRSDASNSLLCNGCSMCVSVTACLSLSFMIASLVHEGVGSENPLFISSPFPLILSSRPLALPSDHRPTSSLLTQQSMRSLPLSCTLMNARRVRPTHAALSAPRLSLCAKATRLMACDRD